jgi:phosphate-selective porin OprO/OprP
MPPLSPHPASPASIERPGRPTRLPRGVAAALVGLLAAGPAALSAPAPAQAPAPAPASLSQPSAPASVIAATAAPAAAEVPTESPADAQTRLVQELLERIRDLERREADRAAAATRASEEFVRALQNRIADLENKVQSLETGRVLPEIALTPEDGPTTAELDQKLRILERKEEIEAEETAARAKETAQLSVGPAGFVLRSADTNFVLRIRGLAQMDTRTFFDDNPLSDGNSGFLLRRARIGLDGVFYRDFDYQFVTDFGGPNGIQVLDANVAYRFRPELRFRVGKFKSPVGYEQLVNVPNLLFNERSLVTDLVPIRNSGAQFEGDTPDQRLSYAAGVYTPAGDGRNGGLFDHGDDLEFGGRILAQPFKGGSRAWLEGLGFGVGGTFTQVRSNALALPNTVGGTRPGYLTPAGQQFFAYNSPAGTVVADGDHWRVSPHLFYLKGPFGVLGEYILAEQGVLNATTLRRAALRHDAWQVAAQWVLTGEPASFGAITPLRPFRPADGGWGAWQLVARYTQFNVDDAAFAGFANPATAASGADSWSVGINWWLNRNLRVLTSFTHTSFDGGGQVNPADPTSLVPPATVTAQDEKALLTRLQIAF